jgi:hypothetical protein
MTTIEKNDRLIQEFMGEEYDVAIVYSPTWDWLMPVVKKINWMKYETNEDLDQRIIIVLRAVLSFDVNQVHKAVVDFLNEYNKTK